MKDIITNKLEAILFYLAEPVSVDFLVKTLETSREEILTAIGDLGLSLDARGLRLVMHDNEVTLVTAPEMAETIEKILREERERDLGRAGIETLAIVAYKGPVSKKEIEYIRGVNCQFVLRNLLLRGLVEKRPAEHDERVMVYNVTADALRHLGLSHVSELPEYEEARKKMEVEDTIITEKEVDDFTE